MLLYAIGGRGEVGGACVCGGHPEILVTPIRYGVRFVFLFFFFFETNKFVRRPQSRRDDPLNLSILLSGGKETN